MKHARGLVGRAGIGALLPALVQAQADCRRCQIAVVAAAWFML
jgi:hypothetical protein